MSEVTALHAHPGQESAAEMARRLAAEARRAAEEAARDAIAALSQAATLSAEVGDLEVLPAGEREVFRQIGSSIRQALEQREAIKARQS